MGSYKKTAVLLLLCLCLGGCKKAEDRIQSYDSLAGNVYSEERKQEETNTASEKMQDKENEKSEQAKLRESAQIQSPNSEVGSSGSGKATSEANGHASDESRSQAEGRTLPLEDRTLPSEENGRSSEENVRSSEENPQPSGESTLPSDESTQPSGENTLPSDESTKPSEEGSSDSGCKHEMVTSWYGEAPDCTHGGYRIVLCRLCGWVSEADSGSVEALEHTPVGQEIQHGNCREDTIIIYTCTACGQQVGYERYPEPGEHSWVYKEQQIWDEEKFAFVTILVQVCERCNIQYQE